MNEKTMRRIEKLTPDINAKFTAAELIDRLVALGNALKEQHIQRERDAADNKEYHRAEIERNTRTTIEGTITGFLDTLCWDIIDPPEQHQKIMSVEQIMRSAHKQKHIHE
jgi:hypothetical protein